MMRAALLTSVAILLPWDGEFRWFHTFAELRAFGLRWSEIEKLALNAAVRWD